MPLQTGLDWSGWNVDADPVQDTTTPPGTGGDPAGGFAKAVEMCNNNGHCRKFDAGTMCPSYRATRDEQHLTRGRANTLRLAVSGQLGSAFASQEVREALELCVSCKGCRRECPTGVDMARMKIEFMHQWQKAHGLSLEERIIAHLPRWAPWAARVPWLANLRDTLPGAARLSERWLGLAAKRTLPSWRRDTFLRSARARTGHADDADVVLFVDTFTNYHEPQNAHAAMAVLEAAGYRVHVARPEPNDTDGERPLCCGRTFLGAGLIDDARHEAQRMVAALRPHVERGAAVVGLEPSCLLSLRDEFLVLGLGDAAQRLSTRAFLIEEFLAAEQRAGRLELPLQGAAPEEGAAARALPPEVVRCDGRHAQRVVARAGSQRRRGGNELLRDGGQLRLRGEALRRVAAHGRARIAARGAQRARRCADRGRRHELPASDRGRHAHERRRAQAGARRVRARTRPRLTGVVGAFTAPIMGRSGKHSDAENAVIDADTAARLLLEARRTRQPLAALPEHARPATDAQSYAIQDAQIRELGPIGGWKVGARTPETEPNCAPLPESLVLPSPQVFERARFALHLVEAEIAFELKSDLPPRSAPYTEEDVIAALRSVHATIEVLDSRYRDFRSVDGPSLLADFLSNGALVVGPGRRQDLRIDQTRTRLQLFYDDRLELEVTGGNTAGDVFRLLVWLANHATTRCGGLRAGEIVTTGSCIGARPAAPGTRVRAVFDGIPPVEATV